jgi:RHS repeat-associated protein
MTNNLSTYLKIALPFFLSLFIHPLSAQTNLYQYDEMGRLKADWKEGIVLIEWNNQNKITRILKADTCHTPDVEYSYDTRGNRLTKTIIPRDGTKRKSEVEWSTQYYEYDLQGNLTTTYASHYKKLNASSFKNSLGDVRNLFYSETHRGSSASDRTLYESSFQAQIDNNGRFASRYFTGSLAAQFENHSATRGEKKLEIHDYLNNVSSVVTDRKLKEGNLDGAETILSKNYYPFGMVMRAEHNDRDYLSFGYGGKKSDDEIKGLDNSYDFGARMYDPRLARWLSIDPLQADYPSHSSYNYGLNSPIAFKDPDGKKVVDASGHEVTANPIQDKNGKWNVEFQFEEGVSKADQTKFKNSPAAKLLRKAARNSEGRKLLNKLNNTDFDIEIESTNSNNGMSFFWTTKTVQDKYVLVSMDPKEFGKKMNKSRQLLKSLAKVNREIEKNLSSEKYDDLVAERDKISKELLASRIPMARGMSTEEYTEFAKIPDEELIPIVMFATLDLISNQKEWLYYYRYDNRLLKDEKRFEANLAFHTLVLKLNGRFKTYHGAYVKEKESKKK